MCNGASDTRAQQPAPRDFSGAGAGLPYHPVKFSDILRDNEAPSSLAISQDYTGLRCGLSRQQQVRLSLGGRDVKSYLIIERIAPANKYRHLEKTRYIQLCIIKISQSKANISQPQQSKYISMRALFCVLQCKLNESPTKGLPQSRTIDQRVTLISGTGISHPLPGLGRRPEVGLAGNAEFLLGLTHSKIRMMRVFKNHDVKVISFGRKSVGRDVVIVTQNGSNRAQLVSARLHKAWDG